MDRRGLVGWLFGVWEELGQGIMLGISEVRSVACRWEEGKLLTSHHPGPDIRIIAMAALPGAVDNA
jgi:hypothetical protein